MSASRVVIGDGTRMNETAGRDSRNIDRARAGYSRTFGSGPAGVLSRDDDGWLPGLPPPPAAGRLDRERRARGEVAGFDRAQVQGGSIGQPQDLPAGPPGPTAVGPIRRDDAVLGQERDRYRLEEGVLAGRPVATPAAAGAARAGTQLESLEPHREALLQDLGVGDARVGHMGVDGVGAVLLWRRAAAAADRLVIAEAGVAEDQVVHGALGARGEAEGLEQRVHDALAGLAVARGDGGAARGVALEARVEHALRDFKVDGPQDSLVE